MTLPIVCSYGMGVDSTAILLRWLEEPDSRDFDLDNLVVLTAMTGDEFADTGRLVREHMLPRFAAAGIRYVQLTRNGPSQADGITVLDDSRAPTTLHLRTPYRLSTELTKAGTVPQYAKGRRLCSIHFKGWPLDTWLADEFGSRPFRHVMGFNAEEQRRVLRDSSYSTVTRRSEYPLVEWGWGRQRCEDYIASVVGEAWAKSCCTFCPFANTHHTDRYATDPDAAVQAMILELRSLALNENMPLFAKGSVLEMVKAAGNDEAVRRFYAAIGSMDWSLYEVRRVLPARKGDPTKKGFASRQVRIVETGSHARCANALYERAASEDVRPHIDDNGLVRLVLHPRRSTYPAVEHFLVIGPAGAEAKERAGFETRWSIARRAEKYTAEPHWLATAMRKGA